MQRPWQGVTWKRVISPRLFACTWKWRQKKMNLAMVSTFAWFTVSGMMMDSARQPKLQFIQMYFHFFGKLSCKHFDFFSISGTYQPETNS